MKFPVKIRDTQKIKKKELHQFLCQEILSKNIFIIDLLLIAGGFRTFMYDYTRHREGKHFCCSCLQSKEILKCHMNDWCEINGNKWLIRLKKVNMLNSKIMRGK